VDWAKTVAVIADINNAALNHPEYACMRIGSLYLFSEEETIRTQFH